MTAQYKDEYKGIIPKKFFDKHLKDKDQTEVDEYFEYKSQHKPASVITRLFSNNYLGKKE